ncbi:HPP family protein [Pseudovibrio sp. SPO723]|uniref:HPP family protein n=1 Tax=Nesiotobacter zosterae TaxID=392721 RepID=UPI0029C539ED|nr:HPP family protein [Pseudovibrio sp. SPO723]MDX5595190.1 HPP family protein [Pseudovibrio sp. SPO723]
MFEKIKGSAKSPARPAIPQILNGLIGGFAGIGVVAYLAEVSNLPLLMAPFGATCVLLFAAPAAPLAQPRNVVLGHLIAASVGLLVLNILGAGLFQMALGVGVAIALMQVFRAVHPPAGANPLVVILGGVTDWWFLVTPVLIGALTLVLIALVLNNLGKGKNWPVYWA